MKSWNYEIISKVENGGLNMLDIDSTVHTTSVISKKICGEPEKWVESIFKRASYPCLWEADNAL